MDKGFLEEYAGVITSTRVYGLLVSNYSGVYSSDDSILCYLGKDFLKDWSRYADCFSYFDRYYHDFDVDEAYKNVLNFKPSKNYLEKYIFLGTEYSEGAYMHMAYPCREDEYNKMAGRIDGSCGPPIGGSLSPFYYTSSIFKKSLMEEGCIAYSILDFVDENNLARIRKGGFLRSPLVSVGALVDMYLDKKDLQAYLLQRGNF